jgi:hypothetical protein
MMMSSCIPPLGRLSEPITDTDTGMAGAREIVYQRFAMAMEILHSALRMRVIRD